jgi:hypothetical protein
MVAIFNFLPFNPFPNPFSAIESKNALFMGVSSISRLLDQDPGAGMMANLAGPAIVLGESSHQFQRQIMEGAL